MQKASKNLQRLIDSLLTYSRLSTKTNPFSMVNLNEVVKEAIDNLETRIRDTNALIEKGDLPTIEADRAQILQLFQNLISNALKFHQKGQSPRVKIYARSSPEEKSSSRSDFQICVEDNGIGIEKQYFDLIFSPFQRLHSKSDYDGVGIGLSICQKIAERHQGRIAVQSEINQGSMFIVSLREAQTA
jgi:light-regulated signal transduction histidine kinase (bacteriophytochrome)